MSNSERINTTVLNWDGVSAHPHRFGGTEYRLDEREIGHIHGERLVDVPLTKKARDQAILEGKAEPHHILAAHKQVEDRRARGEKAVQDSV